MKNVIGMELLHPIPATQTSIRLPIHFLHLLLIETYIALVSQFQTLLPRDDTLMDTASNIAHTSDLPLDPDLIPIT